MNSYTLLFACFGQQSAGHFILCGGGERSVQSADPCARSCAENTQKRESSAFQIWLSKSRDFFLFQAPVQWVFMISGSFFGIRLCTVDRPSGMLRRRIDRRELQRAVSGIQNIMPCTTRHKGRISHTKPALYIQLVLAGAHTHSRLPCFHTNELICIRMHFHTDVTASRDTHERHLQMASAPERCAKMMILPRCAGDICSKWLRAVIGLTVASHRTMKFHDIRSFPHLVFHIYAAADGTVNHAESYLSILHVKILPIQSY